MAQPKGKPVLAYSAGWERSKKKTLRIAGSCSMPVAGEALRHGTIDRAVRLSDPRSHQPYYSDNKDGDKRENDGVLDQPLTFLFWCEEHNNKSFLIKLICLPPRLDRNAENWLHFGLISPGIA